jgi:hypothetical protein
VGWCLPAWLEEQGGNPNERRCGQSRSKLVWCGL